MLPGVVFDFVGRHIDVDTSFDIAFRGLLLLYAVQTVTIFLLNQTEPNSAKLFQNYPDETFSVYLARS